MEEDAKTGFAIYVYLEPFAFLFLVLHNGLKTVVQLRKVQTMRAMLKLCYIYFPLPTVVGTYLSVLLYQNNGLG